MCRNQFLFPGLEAARSLTGPPPGGELSRSLRCWLAGPQGLPPPLFMFLVLLADTHSIQGLRSLASRAGWLAGWLVAWAAAWNLDGGSAAPVPHSRKKLWKATTTLQDSAARGEEVL